MTTTTASVPAAPANAEFVRRRSPLDRELLAAGTSRREVAGLADLLRGPAWLYGFDSCQVLAADPVVAKAIAAHLLDAVARELKRVGEAITTAEMMAAVVQLRWVNRRDGGQIRTAFQIFDQAARDARGKSSPDRFAELVDCDGRTAVRALAGILVLFTHQFPDEVWQS